MRLAARGRRAERLGVLGVRTRSLDAVRLRRCRTLAGILAMAIASKRAYSDSFARRARTEPMQLPAEMLRAYLPPRTIGNAHVVSTAVLEPAYEIGGDAFDHSLTQSTLHAAILDAMGHDLASGLTTSVALAGCRNARRAGAGCPTLWRPSTRPSPSGFPTSTARASSPSSTSPRAY